MSKVMKGVVHRLDRQTDKRLHEQT